MEIQYTYRAKDDLEKLPKLVQRRIAKKMRFYAEQADPLKFAKRLSGNQLEEYRFRIGEYRVCFDVADERIIVLKIAKRDKIYE